MSVPEQTFAERVIQFNHHLDSSMPLPEGVRMMNPYLPDTDSRALSDVFYRKFYSDTAKRRLILGINPGRLGAGATGIPFTDSKRLATYCGIAAPFQLHEPSSVFVYDVIDAYGGVDAFYRDFFIGAVCPLGFVKRNARGKEVNYNYYDSKALTDAVMPFILRSLKEQIALGINTDVVYVFGNGKNTQFLQKLNQAHGFFERIVPLEHPRYVMQYKSKSKDQYVQKFLDAFADGR
jgi:hypothetical protein